MGSYYYSTNTAPVWPGYTGWPGYGYYGTPQVTYVPRIRQNPGQALANPAAGGLDSQPLPETLSPQDVFQPEAHAPAKLIPTETQPVQSDPTAVKPAPQPTAPQTFAEEVGDQVGRMVTRLIEENPQWEQKLRDMDVQQYLNDPNTLLSGVHEAYQKTPMLKWASKQFSNQLVKALPDQFEPVATQVVDWLNRPLQAAAV